MGASRYTPDVLLSEEDAKDVNCGTPERIAVEFLAMATAGHRDARRRRPSTLV